MTQSNWAPAIIVKYCNLSKINAVTDELISELTESNDEKPMLYRTNKNAYLNHWLSRHMMNAKRGQALITAFNSCETSYCLE